MLGNKFAAENFLFSTAEEEAELKIIDFGLSKEIASEVR